MSYLDFADARPATAIGGRRLCGHGHEVADQGRVADRVTGTYISDGAFQLLGRPPRLGREFAPEDNLSGRTRGVVEPRTMDVRYGADPAVVGRNVIINGVAPPSSAWYRSGFVFRSTEISGSRSRGCRRLRINRATGETFPSRAGCHEPSPLKTPAANWRRLPHGWRRCTRRQIAT